MEIIKTFCIWGIFMLAITLATKSCDIEQDLYKIHLDLSSLKR